MEPLFVYTPLEQDIQITHIISLFHEKYPRNFCFEGEKHDFWELVYIDKGQLLITAGKDRYVLKAGEMVFHKPGEFHALEAYENVASNVITASFVCDAPCMRHFEHRYMTLTTQEREYLYEAARLRSDLLGIETDEIGFGVRQIVRNDLELLLIHLLRRTNSTAIRSRVESYVQQTRTKELVGRIEHYMEENLTKKLTLAELAADMGYSVSYMTKLYRHKTGKSIIDSFLELKMTEARRQIQEGSLTVTQIANGLGYDNIAYFSRLFRQHFSISPSECAKAYKEA